MDSSDEEEGGEEEEGGTDSRVQAVLLKYSNVEEEGGGGERRTFSVCARGICFYFFTCALFELCGRALRCFDALGAASEIKKQLSEIELETVNHIKGTVC